MGDANAALINGNVVTFATQDVFLVNSYVVNMFAVRVHFIHGRYRVADFSASLLAKYNCWLTVRWPSY